MQQKFIFIVSAPRSGSTWLGNLFDSHPDVIYRHEPLARLAPLIESEIGLLHRLKHAHGVSEGDRRDLLKLLQKAHPESDRPPFFKKSFSCHPTWFRFLLWTAAIKWGEFFGIYEMLFSRSLPGSVLVVKETGWSSHLESIVDGLQPTATLLLVRHPCAIIASVLRGIDSGLMRVPDEKTKKAWYNHHQQNDFIINNKIKEKDVLQMETVTFWSLRLRVLYEIFLLLQKNNLNKVLPLVYEEIQREPLEKVDELFSRLGLSLAPSVTAFIAESTGRKSTAFQALQKRGKKSYFSVHRQKDYDPMQWRQQLSPAEIGKIYDAFRDTDILERFWPLTPSC